MYFSTLNEAYGDQSLDGMYVKKIEGPPVAPAPAVHGTMKEKKCGCACKGGYQETNTLLVLIIFLMMVFKK